VLTIAAVEHDMKLPAMSTSIVRANPSPRGMIDSIAAGSCPRAVENHRGMIYLGYVLYSIG